MKALTDWLPLFKIKNLGDKREKVFRSGVKKDSLVLEYSNVARYAFVYPTLESYQRFIEEGKADVLSNRMQAPRAADVIDMVNSKKYVVDMISKRNEQWFGTTDTNEITNDPTQYLFNDTLQSWLEQVKKKTVNVDVTDIDQVKRIEFTDCEIGVFSFDLALLGLIRVYEYWSPVLEKIVLPNNVITERNENGQIIRDQNGKAIFWHKHKPEVEAHTVAFEADRGGFYSHVLGRVVDRSELVAKTHDGIEYFEFPHLPAVEKHIVVQRQKLDSNGKPQWSTTFKKCFIHTPKVEKTLPRIDIIITAAFNHKIHAATEMPYASVAAIALAEKLSKANVNYRILVAHSSESPETSRPCMQMYSFIIAKREGEVLDKNKISLMVSDARNYRFSSFAQKALSFAYCGFDGSVNSTIGYPINDDRVIVKNDQGKYEIRSLKNDLVLPNTFNSSKEADDYFIQTNGMPVNRIKTAYLEYLENSDDASDRAASKLPDSKIVFSGALNEQDAINQYDFAIRQITRI